jgi:DNA-binding XRE family transcriptional regulator
MESDSTTKTSHPQSAAPKTRGRPTKYDPSCIPLVKKLCEKFGATDNDIAEFLGVDRDTIYEWKKKFPEFADALKDSKAQFDNEIEASMAMAAKGHMGPDDKYYPPNPTMAIFWLKNRRPEKWRDKQDLEHSGQIQVVPALVIKS